MIRPTHFFEADQECCMCKFGVADKPSPMQLMHRLSFDSIQQKQWINSFIHDLISWNG